MKLSDLDVGSLRELERILGNLLIDMEDMTITQLHDKVLEMLGQ